MVKGTGDRADTRNAGEHTLDFHLEIRQRVTQRRCHAQGDEHVPRLELQVLDHSHLDNRQRDVDGSATRVDYFLQTRN
jgi:hypothetical protein